MSNWRTASGLQLLLCACFTVWVLGNLGLQQRIDEWNPPYLLKGFDLFWLIQGCILTLSSLRANAVQYIASQVGLDALASSLIPVPLLLLAALIGIAPPFVLLTVQSFLIITIVLLSVSVHWVGIKISHVWIQQLLLSLTQAAAIYLLFRLFPYSGLISSPAS